MSDQNEITDNEVGLKLLTAIGEMKQMQANKLTKEGMARAKPKIAQARILTGLTQKEFANAIGISLSTLQGWEQDRRKPDKTANALINIVFENPQVVIQMHENTQ